MPPTDNLYEVSTVYAGSNAEATKALYQRLEQLGPLGAIAMNLLRAQKNSSRAKVYRGRGFKDAAYERKQWAMGQLTAILAQHAGSMVWGWQQDAAAPIYQWVLYVELPTGQVSFHSATRGVGPDFPGAWDKIRDASPGRICRFAAEQLAREASHAA